MSVIGGASGELSRSERRRDTPLGPLTALFGYPFWIFGKTLEQKAEQATGTGGAPGSATSSTGPPNELPQTADEIERDRLQRENEELQRALQRQAERPPAPRPEQSIADELAGLRASLDQRSAQQQQSRRLSTPERVREAVDRNGDGRPDLWLYEDSSGKTRQVLDENADGRPDQIHIFGPDRELLRTEEDLDGDGQPETISLYEAGQTVRRRADTNHDGVTDTWSFYENGEVVRHEVDRDGDGFRDLTLFYEEGELIREEQDANGDGRPDVVVRYSKGQISAREEDLDYDGTPDVLSFYENGKLIRKEVRSEELLRGGGS
jgi:hypothetical protein